MRRRAVLRGCWQIRPKLQALLAVFLILDLIFLNCSEVFLALLRSWRHSEFAPEAIAKGSDNQEKQF